MKVRKTTFKKNLTDKERAFLNLTGEERLQLMCKVSERLRKPDLIINKENLKRVTG
jgi:hypothetical protein